MTQPRLGGWLRLWIILCVVYGVVVVTVTAIDMPSKAAVPEHAAFLRVISDDSLKVLTRGINPDLRERRTGIVWDDELNMAEAKRRGITPTPSLVLWKSFETPDGFTTMVPADVTKAEEDRIRTEYDNMMVARLAESRWSRIRVAALWWLVPGILILCAGLAARWVYRGFRGNQE
jgi:hypothetical protein